MICETCHAPLFGGLCLACATADLSPAVTIDAADAPVITVARFTEEEDDMEAMPPAIRQARSGARCLWAIGGAVLLIGLALRGWLGWDQATGLALIGCGALAWPWGRGGAA